MMVVENVFNTEFVDIDDTNYASEADVKYVLGNRNILIGKLRKHREGGLLEFAPNETNVDWKSWWADGFTSVESALRWISQRAEDYDFRTKKPKSWGKERMGFHDMTGDEILSLNHYSRTKVIEMELFQIYEKLKDGEISRERFDRERAKWNALWESAKKTLPPDTRADVHEMEATLELANSVK